MSMVETVAPPSAPPAALPPLENGDHLTRDEFERRYAAMPHLKKAELLRGIVYLPSPVSLARHGEPHLLLGGWLGHYKMARAIDWFVLRGDRYEPLAPGEDGILRSEHFPGLWLDPKRLGGITP